MQFFGGGEQLYGFLATEESRDAFLFLRDGTHTGGTFSHFGQVVHQKTVRIPLSFYRFPNVQ